LSAKTITLNKIYFSPTILKLVVAMMFWSGGFVAGRVLVSEVPVAQSSFFRFALATMAIYVACFYKKTNLSLKKIEILPLVFLGLTGITFYNLFFFGALKNAEAARAAVIIGSNPVLVMIGSYLIFKEHLGFQKIFGIVSSVFGAYYVLTKGQISIEYFQDFSDSDLYLVGAMVSWAAYSLIAKKYNSLIDPLKLQFYSGLFGTICLLPTMIYEYQATPKLSGFLTFDGFTSLMYLAIFPTAFGFYWYVDAITKMGAATASQFINLVPIFTVLLGAIILGEFPDISLFLGGSLVICGLFLGKIKRRT
jgi:drug/metabolite transporter (DMT)-like permease